MSVFLHQQTTVSRGIVVSSVLSATPSRRKSALEKPRYASLTMRKGGYSE